MGKQCNEAFEAVASVPGSMDNEDMLQPLSCCKDMPAGPSKSLKLHLVHFDTSFEMSIKGQPAEFMYAGIHDKHDVAYSHI